MDIGLFGGFSVRASFSMVWSNGTDSFCMRLRNGADRTLISMDL